MRLATFIDPQRGNDARFGIISGDDIVDVVATADRLHRAVPATTVKTALTSGEIENLVAYLSSLRGKSK
jgi:5-carboxymethyl-2-hydroxymuconate isomerase